MRIRSGVDRSSPLPSRASRTPAAADRGRRMRTDQGDQIGQVAPRNQAAAVIEAAERQRQAAPRQPEQRAEIAPDPGTVNQRRAQDDEFDPGLGGNRRQRPFGGELGAAVGVLRERGVLGEERVAGRGRLAHRLDRTDIDEPARARDRGRPGQHGGGSRLGFENGPRRRACACCARWITISKSRSASPQSRSGAISPSIRNSAPGTASRPGGACRRRRGDRAPRAPGTRRGQ